MGSLDGAFLGACGAGGSLVLRLKADLHAHTADDFHDRLGYSSEMFIDAAAKLNYDVVAIASHDRVSYTSTLGQYALRRNVVLMPALESRIEGKHVVILNPDEEQAEARTFERLRELGPRNAVIMAPHPFYPDTHCLGRKLLHHLDCFNAIEFCSLYRPWLNPNRRAVNLAKRQGLPLIGTSDCHTFPYAPTSWAWLEARERSVMGVIDAIRCGRVSLESHPRPVGPTVRAVASFVRDRVRDMYSNQR